MRELKKTHAPLQVRTTPGRGRGLFATRDVEEGSCFTCSRLLQHSELMPTDKSTEEFINKCSTDSLRSMHAQLDQDIGIPALSTILKHKRFPDLVHFCSEECKYKSKSNPVLRRWFDIDRVERWLDEKRKVLTEIQSSTLALLVRLIAETIHHPNGRVVKILQRMVWIEMESSYVFPGQRIPDEYNQLLDLIPQSREIIDAATLLRLESIINLNSFVFSTSLMRLEVQNVSANLQICNVGESSLRETLKLTAIYSLSSLFNHSCEPNVGLRAPRPSNEVTWLTLRPVSEGEELLISYVPTDMDLHERRSALKSGYGFECNCPKCSKG